MRILTHNMLMCNVKKCSMQGYPLKIVPQNVETVESDFNPEFMQHMLPKLNWEGILSAANDVRACMQSTSEERQCLAVSRNR